MDDGLALSWIDNFVCSPVIDTLVADADVLYGYMCSDHRALSVGVSLHLHLASENKSTEPRL